MASDGILCESERTPVDVTILTVGVPEQNADGINVYPNPAADQLTVDLGTVRGTTSVDLLDITGRVVMSVANAQQAGKLQINIGALAGGEYMVRVNHDGGTSMHRVVIR